MPGAVFARTALAGPPRRMQSSRQQGCTRDGRCYQSCAIAPRSRGAGLPARQRIARHHRDRGHPRHLSDRLGKSFAKPAASCRRLQELDCACPGAPSRAAPRRDARGSCPRDYRARTDDLAAARLYRSRLRSRGFAGARDQCGRIRRDGRVFRHCRPPARGASRDPRASRAHTRRGQAQVVDRLEG